MQQLLATTTIRQDYKKPALAILFFFGALNLLVSILNHYFFRSYAFDFTAYNFAFYDYAHWRVSGCPIYLFPYEVTFLQDHFSLTLMILSPLYWIFGAITGTYTLLIIQNIIVAAGGWFTYRLILFRTANGQLALLSLVYYFILLGRLTACVADCNLAIIGSALVPMFIFYFEKEKTGYSVVLFLLLIFNREDFALWLVFICSYLAIVHRGDKIKRTRSIIFLAASVVFFAVIFKFIIPALEDENKKYTLFNFAVLGENPARAVSFIFQHPLRALELLFVNHSGNSYFDGIKQEFYLVFLVSGGALLLLRPAYLLPFLPLIAKKMYNDEPIRWSMESYYSVEIVSLLPLIIFLLIGTFNNKKVRISLAYAVCIATLIITVVKLTKPADKHIALMGDTQKFNFLNRDFYRSGYDVQEIYNAMKLIPDTAKVCASGRLSTHLAFREKIYYFPRVDDADYIFVISKNDSWPISQGRADSTIARLLTEGQWELLLKKRDFVLMHKR